MTYKDLLHDPETRGNYFVEELGIPETEMPERVVITPTGYESVLPADFTETLQSAGLNVEEYEPGDHILKKLGKNYLVSDGARSFSLHILGRGLVEFTDRMYILATSERAKDILLIGTAASLTEQVLKEDINLPEVVIPFESISNIHVDATRAVPLANQHLHREIMKYAKRYASTQVHNALHATVTLFYQETRDFLEYLRDVGVATIDMEVSAFYRIARYSQKRAVAILRAVDMPIHDLHYLAEKYERFRQAEREKTKQSILKTVVAFGLGETTAERL
ncbi:MAG: purine-nucleoside phosphorylase [Candidatus Diapherotrites archaeon]|nr:purine-nucleoside phosphorylase [Candidatus Diapherotrites archaeon]